MSTHVSMNAGVHGCVSMHQRVGVHKCSHVPVSGRELGEVLVCRSGDSRALLWSWLQAGIHASGDQQVERESHRESVGQGGLWAVDSVPKNNTRSHTAPENMPGSISPMNSLQPPKAREEVGSNSVWIYHQGCYVLDQCGEAQGWS